MSPPQTIKDVVTSIDLRQLFETRFDKSRTTEKEADWEKTLFPLLAAVSLNSKWLEEKLGTFLTDYGHISASDDTIWHAVSMSHFEYSRVVKYRNSWDHKSVFINAFDQLLLGLAASCVKDILCSLDINITIAIHQEDGKWAKPDLACRTKPNSTDTLKLYHLLVEIKTVNVLDQLVANHMKNMQHQTETGAPTISFV